MFSIITESLSYLAGRRTVFSDKTNQTCFVDNARLPPKMEGSVAACKVSPCRTMLTKRYSPGAKEQLRRTSNMFHSGGCVLDSFVPGAKQVLDGLADACLNEVDAEREFGMQRAFGRFAESINSIVCIPKPLEVLHDRQGLVMAYLGDDADRFSDCTSDAFRARALVEVSRLFFSAVQEVGLVHGDLSATNILILGDGRPCLVDFGCCVTLTDGGKNLLQTRENVEHNSQAEKDTAFVIELWDDRKWKDDWAERLNTVDVTSMNLGEDRAAIPGLALVLRSIFALTIMAKQVPPKLMRVAEAEWVCANPINAAEQDLLRRNKLLKRRS
jgi:hypothetical protein